MRRLCFVIAYFGKLPDYFPLFLKTCGANPEFDWLIFTDDESAYPFPDNVRRVAMTFDECRQLVRSRFDCPVAFERPYKLCDLKPMYGYIFESYLHDFRYWGHCDLDTLMGNLGHWLTDDFLDQYDKIFCLGHMTIYRNTESNNRVFMSKHLGHYPYEEVLAKADNCWFDEEWNNPSNINRIFLDRGLRVYQEDLSLNVSFVHNDFRRIRYVGHERPTDFFGYEEELPREALYLWEKGALYRLYREGRGLSREDFPYIHLQQRPMAMEGAVLNADCFQIIPDCFRPFSEPLPIGIEAFDALPKRGNSHQERRLLLRRIRNFSRRLLGLNKKK